jgi:Ser/Thr protein kinase RdoA (MazF antagonist)
VFHASLDYAERILGKCELAEDCSWTHQMSTVLRLRDASGTMWFLKRHRERGRYLAEVTAYRRWVPALGDRAPRLRACDDSLRIIIMSAVPGNPAPWPAAARAAGPSAQQTAEAVVQYDAGAVLRRLHEAQPALPWGDFGSAKLGEFDHLKSQASGLLTARELATARTEVEALMRLPCPVMVPCHRDYTPRNWLVDDHALYIVDFEWSRTDAWVSDLARLHLGIWEARPDLQAAFLRGYGLELDDTDQAILHGCAVLTAVWLLIKARETGQPSFEDATRASLQRLLSARP